MIRTLANCDENKYFISSSIQKEKLIHLILNINLRNSVEINLRNSVEDVLLFFRHHALYKESKT